MEQEHITEEVSTGASLTRKLNYRTVTIGAALAVIVVGGIGYYLFSGTQENPQQAQQQEIQELVAAVGKLMVLPTGEQPVIATVADPEKLKDQPFFANAKKGAKVLIYNTARKAILYDPAEKRIVDVAPLNVGSTATPAPKK
jgi:hypothetical protein